MPDLKRIEAQPRDIEKERIVLEQSEGLLGQRVLVMTKDWWLTGILTEVETDYIMLDLTQNKKREGNETWNKSFSVHTGRADVWCLNSDSRHFVNIQAVLAISQFI